MIVLYFIIAMAIIVFLPFFVGKLFFKVINEWEENLIILWCFGGIVTTLLFATIALAIALAIHASMAFSNFLNK